MQDAFGLKTSFVWFENYQDLFKNGDYYKTFGTTALFSIAVGVLSLSFALVLAVQADKHIKGQGVYRTLLIWPYAVAPAVAGVLWLFMFHPSLGIIARALQRGGLDWNPLLNGNHAFSLVVLASVWKQISYNFLFFLAGLQAIPRAVIEAAAIDGAKPRRRFWTIIFPLLSPTTFFLLVVNVVYVFFDTFGIIDVVTGGGPVEGDGNARLQGLLRRPPRRRSRRLGGAVGDPAVPGRGADRRAVPLHRAQGDVLMVERSTLFSRIFPHVMLCIGVFILAFPGLSRRHRLDALGRRHHLRQVRPAARRQGLRKLHAHPVHRHLRHHARAGRDHDDELVHHGRRHRVRQNPDLDHHGVRARLFQVPVPQDAVLADLSDADAAGRSAHLPDLSRSSPTSACSTPTPA